MISSWLRPLVFLIVCTTTSLFSADKPLVLVSVAPYKYLVERIAGDTVSVGLLVPPAANVHTYEPSMKQVLASGKADMWFRIGESFEPRVIKAITAYNHTLALVDLRQGLNLIEGEGCGCHEGCCHPEGKDLHFWLSARLMQAQAKTVAEALIKRYPQNATQYQKALNEHLAELNSLDHELEGILQPVHGKTVLVTHPAYAYLCRDYDLFQLSVETEGKDPSSKKLTAILNKAEALKVKTIFTQTQYSDKAAKIIAQRLAASLVLLDPYAENYMMNLVMISKNFARP